MNDTLLSVQDVAVTFRTRGGRERRTLRALDGVSFDLQRGEILGLVGESGSGKSTLARLIVGLNASSAGSIHFDETLLSSGKRSPELRRRIQMVFQDPSSSLNPRMTVYQQIAELLRVHHIVPRQDIRDRCAQLLSQVHLDGDLLRVRPHQMSGGQCQRVAIARALALSPELLVADEPLSALDVSIQAGIVQLLSELRDQLGLTILFIAHDLAVVRSLCDRVAVMYMGRLVECGTTDSIFDDPRHPYTRALLSAIPRLSPALDTKNGPAVRGEPPSLVRLPSGCRFRSRCPLATELCEQIEPNLMNVVDSEDASHQVACHFTTGRVTANDPEFSS
jgi:oligopeptide/dipeptide ABC transporter ATP-binding protein